LVESLYAQAQKLENAFNYFDTDGDGIICREEFIAG
jgi:Ca2+-binding EF-hand superfamily protein